MTKKIVYKFEPFITVYKENFKNKYQSRKNFHKIKLQDAVMVLLENEKGQILFLNEYRRGINKKTIGLPGGHVEVSEKPIHTIKRELLEETGYLAKEWKLLFKYTRNGTYHCGNDFIFIAKLSKKSSYKKKHENLPKKWIDRKKMLSMLKNNKFETAGMMATVALFLLFKK
jgi:8-oxo-dGTP pyrophosphatase MutT (NUDIX family)